MNIKHHPDDATILAYASGTLDEAFAVIVSCHLEVCHQCRDQLASANAIGGSALEDLGDTVAPDEGAFGRLLEKISVLDESGDENKTPTPTRQNSENWQNKPRALDAYLDTGLAEIQWKRVGPGIWQKPIAMSSGASSSLRLLRIEKGRKVPEHGHGGQELTLILQGAYRDEIGHFETGDVADLDIDVEHQPIVVSEEDCICLAATESPTKFKGLASRLLQPLVGI